MKYFEDWLFTSDAEIEPYNYLGMACSFDGRRHVGNALIIRVPPIQP
jgi:hypothetical protein